MRRNYRKIYKDYYKASFEKELEIHHIDEDKNNNAIDNLILLPSNIHNLYHQYAKFAFIFHDVGFKNVFFNMSINMQIDMRELSELYFTISSWTGLKNEWDMAILHGMQRWNCARVCIDDDMTPKVEYDFQSLNISETNIFRN